MFFKDAEVSHSEYYFKKKKKKANLVTQVDVFLFFCMDLTYINCASVSDSINVSLGVGNLNNFHCCSATDYNNSMSFCDVNKEIKSFAILS